MNKSLRLITKNCCNNNKCVSSSTSTLINNNNNLSINNHINNNNNKINTKSITTLINNNNKYNVMNLTNCNYMYNKKLLFSTINNDNNDDNKNDNENNDNKNDEIEEQEQEEELSSKFDEQSYNPELGGASFQVDSVHTVENEAGNPWNCRACGHTNSKGYDPVCDSCGTPKEEFPFAKKGDFICLTCEHLNFGFRPSCMKCGADRPDGRTKKGHSVDGVGEDWKCPACSSRVFAPRTHCFVCNTEMPEFPEIYDTPRPRSERRNASPGFNNNVGGGMRTNNFGGGGGGMPQERPGDWYCPACGDLVFSFRTNCRTCGEPKPMGDF